MAGAVTREEHYEAIRRLEAADTELRAALERVEDRLRRETDEKIEKAIEAAGKYHAEVAAGQQDDLDEIKSALRWQNRTIGGGVVTVILTGCMYLVLNHYHVL